jgi:hypothetical protein
VFVLRCLMEFKVFGMFEFDRVGPKPYGTVSTPAMHDTERFFRLTLIGADFYHARPVKRIDPLSKAVLSLLPKNFLPRSCSNSLSEPEKRRK